VKRSRGLWVSIVIVAVVMTAYSVLLGRTTRWIR